MAIAYTPSPEPDRDIEFEVLLLQREVERLAGELEHERAERARDELVVGSLLELLTDDYPEGVEFDLETLDQSPAVDVLRTETDGEWSTSFTLRAHSSKARA